MKIAVLMGSPRKKDGLNICKEIELKLGGKSNTYDYIFLNDYKVQDCKGCGLCFKKSENFCPCKDEVPLIKERLMGADGIIFVTPVYAYQVPATLKRIIDRMSFLFHRQELVGKPALIVVTSDGGGYKQVSKYMKMTVSGWGCNLVGTISIISPMYFKDNKDNSAWGYNEKYYSKMQAVIINNTEQFKKAMERDRPKTPSFYEIFMFNCLRTKTFTSKADYDFWSERGWLESSYFYEVKLNPIKKIFGALLRTSIDVAGRKLKNKVA